MKIKITKKYMDAGRIINGEFETQVIEVDANEQAGYIIDKCLTADEFRDYFIYATNISETISFPVQRGAFCMYTKEDLNIYLYDEREDVYERAVDESVKNELLDIIKKQKDFS